MAVIRIVRGTENNTTIEYGQDSFFAVAHVPCPKLQVSAEFFFPFHFFRFGKFGDDLVQYFLRKEAVNYYVRKRLGVGVILAMGLGQLLEFFRLKDER